MSNYKTSRGRIVDMNSIIQKNERTRAVGNMKVNARGDTIDSEGNVITPVTEKVAEKYAQTVGSSSAKVRQKPQHKPAETSDFTNEEKELLDDDISDEELAELKAKDKKK